ncbi:ribonuclease P protein component 1 [Natronomonas sp. F2-12]|jgi:ribonuclease P protein subunit POP4|uniref:Ribonuclease P protein component 1 n=1 Tax=Natronomonas aquatica TaxID=2841590 RepID=A0A9R1CWR6_9EURY|nr:ribonuclease P protein component 1 [Natronomonas aquatica]MCQ4335034.1 ribonuclease P protein component 1 [Natronomonas aquatica]
MTPETLVRHELAGLDVTVTDAPNPDLIGIEGRVRDETMRTLLVATGEGVKQVPKAGTTFRFALDDTDVIVEGDRLLARPALRTETQRGSLWQ